MSFYLTRPNPSETNRIIRAIKDLIVQKCESYNDPQKYKEAQESFTDMCTIGPWTDDPKKEKEFKKWYEFLMFIETELSDGNFEEREFEVDKSIREATEDEHFVANIRAYSALFKIALIYGFEPKGDIPFSNDGGWVDDEDALNWAKAIESSLDDIPDQKAEPLPEKVEEINSKMKAAFESEENFVLLRQAIQANPHASILEVFSGKDGKDYLKEFITFLKGGGFSTW